MRGYRGIENWSCWGSRTDAGGRPVPPGSQWRFSFPPVTRREAFWESSACSTQLSTCRWAFQGQSIPCRVCFAGEMYAAQHSVSQTMQEQMTRQKSLRNSFWGTVLFSFNLPVFRANLEVLKRICCMKVLHTEPRPAERSSKTEKRTPLNLASLFPSPFPVISPSRKSYLGSSKFRLAGGVGQRFHGVRRDLWGIALRLCRSWGRHLGHRCLLPSSSICHGFSQVGDTLDPCCCCCVKFLTDVSGYVRHDKQEKDAESCKNNPVKTVNHRSQQTKSGTSGLCFWIWEISPLFLFLQEVPGHPQVSSGMQVTRRAQWSHTPRGQGGQRQFLMRGLWPFTCLVNLKFEKLILFPSLIQNLKSRNSWIVHRNFVSSEKYLSEVFPLICCQEVTKHNLLLERCVLERVFFQKWLPTEIFIRESCVEVYLGFWLAKRRSRGMYWQLWLVNFLHIIMLMRYDW